MDLLEKASIILTPTAYNNGEALCVKPSDGSGDFDFSRNSAATRVNAQGLVENVQILSSNLVQNGDFSQEGAEEVSNGSFSQEGSELIVNGDFATDSDWDLRNAWVISNGVCSLTAPNSNYLSSSFIFLTANKSYKLTFDIVVNSGNLQPQFFDSGFQTIGTYNTSQSVEVYFKSTTNGTLYFKPNSFDGSIDNVSVKEVGQDWTLGTGWSIGEDKATVDNTVNANLDQTCLTSGKIYKVSFEISDLLSGGIFVGDIVNPGAYDATSNGSHTFYYTATNSTLRVRGKGYPCSVTNISVKEVGQNWDLGTGWSIGNNVAISDATQGYIVQTDVGGAGVTANYKIQWVQNITAGTRLRFFARNYNDGGNATILSITRDDGLIIGGGNCIGSGTFTAYVSSTNGYSFKLLAEAGVEADITNITTIQITTDTNLPRINYEGFSYQDALGSELVVNGDFATDSDWSLGTGWSIGDNKLIHTGSGSYAEQGSLTAGTEYKVVIDVAEASGSGFPQIYMGGLTTAMTAPDIYTFYITAQSGDTIRVRGVNDCKINSISVKEYSGQEVVPDSGCGSWLFEPQSTNLVTYSEDFSQSFWTKQASVTLDKGYLAPDGTYNATKISGVIGSSYVVSQGGILSSSSTKSIWAKTTSGTGVIHLGANQNQSNASFTVTNEWQRFEVTGTTTDVYAVDFRNASTTLSEVLVWGAQGENLSYATSYIPTEGTTVTRNQDVCNNGGSLASINSTEGVLYAEIAALADDLTYRLISLTQGTNGGNRLYLGFANTSNQIRVRITSGGATQVDITQSLSNIKDFNKIAFKYKENDFALWVNGIKVATDTNGLTAIGLNNLSFETGSSLFFGKTKALAVYKEALSDEELTELTTI